MNPPSITPAEAQELYNYIRSGKASMPERSFNNMKRLNEYFDGQINELYKFILKAAGGRSVAERNYQSSNVGRMYRTQETFTIFGSQITSAESLEKDPFANLENPEHQGREILKGIYADVRVYEDGAVQTQWTISADKKLSVLIERNSDGDWILSLWRVDPRDESQVDVDEISLSEFREEYLALTSACVQALALSQGNSNFLRRFCVASNNSWIRLNFLQEWQTSLNQYDVHVNLVSSNAPFGVTQSLKAQQIIIENQE